MTRKPTPAKSTDSPGDFAALIKVIKDSVTVFDPPPADFDPFSASPQQLQEFGFPPRPDPVRLPLLHMFWRRMFDPPTYFEKFDLLSEDLTLVANLLTDRLRASLGGPTRRQGSLNWSGAYVTPRDGTIFNSVHGAWQVPTPQRPGPASAGSTFFSSSTWVGLDGQRRYYQSSLPQIGTGQDLDVAAVPPDQYRAWWQWWVRDLTGAGIPIPLPHPVVRHGDFMMASIYANTARDGVKFIIKNISNGQATMFDQAAPSPTAGNPPLRISGATAEWIMERPSVGSQIQILPNYGTVLFSHCLAVAADPHGGPNVERNVEVAKRIDMREVRHNPERTAIMSITKAVDEDEFMAVYR